MFLIPLYFGLILKKIEYIFVTDRCGPSACVLPLQFDPCGTPELCPRRVQPARKLYTIHKINTNTRCTFRFSYFLSLFIVFAYVCDCLFNWFYFQGWLKVILNYYFILFFSLSSNKDVGMWLGMFWKNGFTFYLYCALIQIKCLFF